MKFFLTVIPLFIGIYNLYAQKYDLIKLNSGDSIVCNIDSINNHSVYVHLLSRGNWVNTTMELSKVKNIRHDSVEYYEFKYYRGTSKIRDIRYREFFLEADIGFSTLINNNVSDGLNSGFTVGGGGRINIYKKKFYISSYLHGSAFKGNLQNSVDENLDLFLFDFNFFYRVLSVPTKKMYLSPYIGANFIFTSYYFSYENDNPLTPFEEEVARLSIFEGSSLAFKAGLRFDFDYVFFDVSYLTYKPSVTIDSDLINELNSLNIIIPKEVSINLNQFRFCIGISFNTFKR